MLVDQKARQEAICSYGSNAFQWKVSNHSLFSFFSVALLISIKDLDNQTWSPSHLTDPWSLVTYPHAKMTGNKEFTSTVDGRQHFWASPGECLHRSTLKSLARNISGLSSLSL